MNTETDTPATATVQTKRIVFHRLIPTARLPQRADRAAAGTLPTRAFRYCEPVVTASSFGYYVFPPIGFSLVWDGSAFKWTYDGAGEWLPLTTAQFPHFAAQFDEIAPEGIKGFSPPFIGALHEPGQIQMWTGIVVRTAPGWSTLVRPPANLPRRAGVEMYEGVIETDRWFGPLITNFRVTRTDMPIVFDPEMQLVQVQVLPREALDERGQNDYEITPDASFLDGQDWDDYYQTVVRPNVAEQRPRGHYAATVRKRRKAEGAPD